MFFTDARLEKRVRLLRSKPSVTHSIPSKPEEPGPLTIQPPYNQVPGQDPATKKISLVFNPDNFQEDNRRKEVIKDAKNTAEEMLNNKRRKEGEMIEDEYNMISASDRSVSNDDEYLHSVPVSNRSSPQSTTTIEEAKPAFLGKIYKDLHNKTKIETTKMSTSKNFFNSRETIPIDGMKTRQLVKAEHNKVETNKVEKNKDKNNSVEHGNTEAIGKVENSKPLDNDSIINDILEKVGSKKYTG